MPQQTIDLAYAARLPPKEAVAYFRAKGYNITWNWYEQLADAHARAFTVAKATRMDVLTTIREEVERAVSEGITREEFTRTLAPGCKNSDGGENKSSWMQRETRRKSNWAVRVVWQPFITSIPVRRMGQDVMRR